MKGHSINLIFCIFIMVCSVFSADQLIGKSAIELTGPVTPQIREAQRAKAHTELAALIRQRMERIQPALFLKDGNLAHWFQKDFIDKVILLSKEETSLVKRSWSLTCAVSEKTIDSLFTQRNRQYDSSAVYFANKALSVHSPDSISVALNTGIKALYSAMAITGSSPLDRNGKPVEKSMRQLVQGILNKLTIIYNPPLITGKAGTLPATSIEIQVNIGDTSFMHDFAITGHLANKQPLFTVKTNLIGSAHLPDFKIPFVMQGNFVYVKPDFGRIAGATVYIDAEDLGLQHTEDTDQALIFKIDKTRYALNYKLVQSGISDIPALFADENYIKQYLNDSLPFTPQEAGEKTDIIFDISNRVESMIFPAEGKRLIRTTATITINNLRTGTDRLMHTILLREEEFETGVQIPAGMYFWECNKVLRTEIRSMLNELYEMPVSRY